MVQRYKKGAAVAVSREFNSNQFDCPCGNSDCTETLIDDELLKGLDALCLIFPILKIDSGFRCEKHNAKVGGVSGSQHLLGTAADVSTSFGTVLDVKKASERIDCFANGGIGVYGDGHVHLDTRGKTARW